MFYTPTLDEINAKTENLLHHSLTHLGGGESLCLVEFFVWRVFLVDGEGLVGKKGEGFGYRL